MNRKTEKRQESAEESSRREMTLRDQKKRRGGAEPSVFVPYGYWTEGPVVIFCVDFPTSETLNPYANNAKHKTLHVNFDWIVL